MFTYRRCLSVLFPSLVPMKKRFPVFELNASVPSITSHSPEVKTIKYPKSGTPNPVVDLWVHRFNDDSTYPLNISSHHESDSTLITEVTWISESSLVTKFSDRSSDVRLVLHFNADTKHAKVARKEPADDGWWEITHNTLRIAKDENMGIIEDGYVDVANIDGYNHLVF